MSKRETAIELIHSNRCMINSCLAKEELKQFNGDFAEYIIRQLSILRNQDKKAEEAKKSASILKMPCSETSVSATLEARKCRPTAYSVDKVVEELEGAMWLTTNDDGETNNLSIQVVSFEDAIEIVKQGGVADDLCEWKQASTARYKTSCGYKLEEYFDTKACYCKQCGRKIKIVGD